MLKRQWVKLMEHDPENNFVLLIKFLLGILDSAFTFYHCSFTELHTHPLFRIFLYIFNLTLCLPCRFLLPGCALKIFFIYKCVFQHTCHALYASTCYFVQSTWLVSNWVIIFFYNNPDYIFVSFFKEPSFYFFFQMFILLAIIHAFDSYMTSRRINKLGNK